MKRDEQAIRAATVLGGMAALINQEIFSVVLSPSFFSFCANFMRPL